jgi:hypothetical protein
LADSPGLLKRLHDALPFGGRAEFDQAVEQTLADFDLQVESAWIKATVRSTLPSDRLCVRCDGILRKRRGRRGAFYGCTNYPFCNYTRDVRAPPT